MYISVGHDDEDGGDNTQGRAPSEEKINVSGDLCVSPALSFSLVYSLLNRRCHSPESVGQNKQITFTGAN